jgi:small ligand-binding sensory domain FIST
MRNAYSTAGHWGGGYEEDALQRWASALRGQLGGAGVSLGLVFMSPRFFEDAGRVLDLLRVHARVPLLVGCSSQGLIAGGQEHEDHAGLVLGLYHLPGADLRPFHFTQAQVEEGTGPAYWQGATTVAPETCNGWLVFADPFHLDAERWLRQWNEAYPGVPIVGGLASGLAEESRTQVYLNGEVQESGGVAVAFRGGVRLANVISQGCTPIGESWTITRAEEQCIHEIGSRPAYQVLVETFNALPAGEQQKARGNLFLGLAMNEYLEEFQRGDFLIRNLIGVDPRTGGVYVGASPRTGQTVQFQRRDAAAATEDMALLLGRARSELQDTTIYGGCLCCCNGRGQRLFGGPHHDASLVQQSLGPFGLSGFFCNGEIGPVGKRNFLHGYTASLAVFARNR